HPLLRDRRQPAARARSAHTHLLAEQIRDLGGGHVLRPDVVTVALEAAPVDPRPEPVVGHDLPRGLVALDRAGRPRLAGNEAGVPLDLRRCADVTAAAATRREDADEP